MSEFRTRVRPQPSKATPTCPTCPWTCDNAAAAHLGAGGREAGLCGRLRSSTLLETPPHRPRHGATLSSLDCRRQARILSGQPAMFAAAARSHITLLHEASRCGAFLPPFLGFKSSVVKDYFAADPSSDSTQSTHEAGQRVQLQRYHQHRKDVFNIEPLLHYIPSQMRMLRPEFQDFASCRPHRLQSLGRSIFGLDTLHCSQRRQQRVAVGGVKFVKRSGVVAAISKSQ